jgi:hypothetical protein
MEQEALADPDPAAAVAALPSPPPAPAQPAPPLAEPPALAGPGDELERVPGLTLVTTGFYRAPADGRAVVLVAAVEKKLRGRPMVQILTRLARFPDLRVLALAPALLHGAPVEAWPPCDFLIGFDAKGYPLEKVIAYKDLVRPHVLNNLEAQLVLRDRRDTFAAMARYGIPMAPHLVVSADRTRPGEFAPEDVTVDERGLTAGGVTLPRPFVEKPANADDHDIYIYFAAADGGGAQHLFRKKEDCTSVFVRDAAALRRGSFVYEQFVPTDGIDIKIYSVGYNYSHAEGRKAPVVDGRVLRDDDGKELRCPVFLTLEEKLIAKRVMAAFGQNVCGFDLLRSRDRAYVCDVNGFSFVKRSPKYYDDATRIMHGMIVRGSRPASLLSASVRLIAHPAGRACLTGLGPRLAGSLVLHLSSRRASCRRPPRRPRTCCRRGSRRCWRTRRRHRRRALSCAASLP